MLARFVEGLRQANGILAGTSGMAWKRFFVFNAIGAVIWVTAWSLIGDLAGSHVGAIYDGIVHYFWIALGVAIVGVIALVILHRRRRAQHHDAVGIDAESVTECNARSTRGFGRSCTRSRPTCK